MKSQKQIRKIRKQIRSCIKIGCQCNTCIIKLNTLLTLDIILGDNTPQKVFKALYAESIAVSKRKFKKVI